MTEEMQRLATEIEEAIAELVQAESDYRVKTSVPSLVRSVAMRLEGEYFARKNELENRIKEMRDRFARLRDEASHRESMLADAEERAQVDDANFWFRRFNTSLAIAHGAGFAAVGSKLFDKETPPEIIVAAWHPMAIFAVGMILAGSIPVALYFRRQNVAWALAGLSAALFAAGLFAALLAMWLRADMVWPWQA